MIIDDLKKKMREKKVTQVKLADEMDVTTITMHKWMSGRVRLKAADLERIANYMGCDVVLVERGKNGK